MIQTKKDNKVYPCYKCNVKNTCIIACHKVYNYCKLETQKKENIKT